MRKWQKVTEISYFVFGLLGISGLVLGSSICQLLPVPEESMFFFKDLLRIVCWTLIFCAILLGVSFAHNKVRIRR